MYKPEPAIDYLWLCKKCKAHLHEITEGLPDEVDDNELASMMMYDGQEYCDGFFCAHQLEHVRINNNDSAVYKRFDNPTFVYPQTVDGWVRIFEVSKADKTWECQYCLQPQPISLAYEHREGCPFAEVF